MLHLILAVFVAAVVILIAEILLASLGENETFTNPDRQPVIYGQGAKEIKYLVMGDSTAAGQGGDYEKGIAVTSARVLAKDAKVTLLNIATSGASTSDVLENQAPLAQNFNPDMILIAVGANDVTHLRSRSNLQQDLERSISKLIEANCNVKIVLTGAADMGAIPRFAQPLRNLAGWRTNQLNQTFKHVAAHYQLTFAPIADETGPKFRQNPQLFAADRFHPNNQGYELWNAVITKALDQAIYTQPSHCIE